MLKYNKYIAWLLVTVFTIFGIEKINFITGDTCDKKLMFCPTANMYVYTILESDVPITTEQPNEHRNKIINISCETFFLSQGIVTEEITTSLFLTNNQYFFKPVIHSTPYITLIDPPPINKGSLFFSLSTSTV